MFVSARRIGLSAEVFWRLTPKEWAREMEAAMAREQEDFARGLVQSWHTAVLVNQAMWGKVPPLKRVLEKAKALHAARSQPSKLQREMDVAILGTKLGSGVRPISPEALAALERLGRRLQKES